MRTSSTASLLLAIAATFRYVAAQQQDNVLYLENRQQRRLERRGPNPDLVDIELRVKEREGKGYEGPTCAQLGYAPEDIPPDKTNVWMSVHVDPLLPEIEKIIDAAFEADTPAVQSLEPGEELDDELELFVEESELENLDTDAPTETQAPTDAPSPDDGNRRFLFSEGEERYEASPPLRGSAKVQQTRQQQQQHRRRLASACPSMSQCFGNQWKLCKRLGCKYSKPSRRRRVLVSPINKEREQETTSGEVEQRQLGGSSGSGSGSSSGSGKKGKKGKSGSGSGSGSSSGEDGEDDEDDEEDEEERVEEYKECHFNIVHIQDAINHQLARLGCENGFVMEVAIRRWYAQAPKETTDAAQ